MPMHNDKKREWYANNPIQSEKTRLRRIEGRKARREYLVECKSVPCMDCGVSYPHYVMDFDHRNPKEKHFVLAEAADNNVSWERIKVEISKCDVVCSNCHRIRTHKQRIIGLLV